LKERVIGSRYEEDVCRVSNKERSSIFSSPAYEVNKMGLYSAKEKKQGRECLVEERGWGGTYVRWILSRSSEARISLVTER
jgi:hypothetical protein